MKFAGCYHGHADHLLVAAGSGLATFGKPSSAGVPAAFVECTRVLPLDDDEALEDLFAPRRLADRRGRSSSRCRPITACCCSGASILEQLRAVTRAHGALLIFDEVISGFRVARGGVAELHGIRPDLATFGKIIGGGMPVGAFGGARKIMSRLAPEGDTYQAGTLSGNPVAMSARHRCARRARARERAGRSSKTLGALLERLVTPVLAKARFPIRFVRAGSLFWLALHEGRRRARRSR